MVNTGSGNGEGAGKLLFSTVPQGQLIMALTHATSRVGIGTDSPTHVLHVNGQARSTSASWATSSDRRIKKDVKTIHGGLDIVRRLRPVTFDWSEAYRQDHAQLPKKNFGFIAQEVEAVVPQMVTRVKETVGDEVIEDFRVLDHAPIVPLLVGAIQAQDKTIAKQSAQIEALDARIEALEAAIKTMTRKAKSGRHSCSTAPRRRRRNLDFSR